jgi:hypothetical protein
MVIAQRPGQEEDGPGAPGPAGPVRWVRDPAGYGPGTAAGGVPVLLPASAATAAHWRRVVATLFDRPAAGPPEGGRLVLAWGAGAAQAARVFQAWAGGRLVEAADLAGLLGAVGAAAERYVLVVAPADRLTVGAVGTLSAACRARGALLGVLSGRDAAALSFATAKALLRPRGDLSGVDVFDAPLHRSADNLPRMPDGFLTRLTRPSLVKLLRSHGEGGHAKLPGVVVCGLLDEVEFPAAPDAGCRREPRRCKRAEAVESAVLFGDELAAHVVAFVCCNGFNVAGELYPSPVSMSLAFAQGWAGAVIAPVRPLVAPDDMVAVLHDGLTAGLPFGEIVRELNEMGDEMGQPESFVLHGDPAAALPATRPPTPARDARDVAGDRRQLASLRDRLVLTLRHAERGARLLRSARLWLGDRANGLLDPVDERLARVGQLTVNALKWAETNPSAGSRDRLLRTASLVRLAVGRWDRDVARLLLSARDAVDAFDLGHYDQVLAEVRPGPACRRCATPTEIHVYGRGEPAEHHRLAELCRVCGPVSEGRAEGPRIVVRESPRTGTAGAEFALRAELLVPDVPRPIDTARLHVRFFDKANDVCVYEDARAVPAETLPVELRFRLPDGLGADLHSIRLALVCGFDVAYARARFAGLPA